MSDIKNLEIVVLSGVSKGDIFRFSLATGKELSIGRSPDCDLVLQDPLVSRIHLKIVARREGFFLYDNGSSHGTVLMGFQLTGGEANGRLLTDQDEFKVGGDVFRIAFNGTQFAATKKEASVEKVKTTASSGKLTLTPRTKRLAIIAGALIILLLVVASLFGGKKKGIGKQLSEVPLNFPQERVLGYWLAGSSVQTKDKTHLDKVQFFLPAADVIVEYEFRSEVPVAVYVDAVVIDTIVPEPDNWSYRSAIIRDVLGGVERKLIFDNENYPFRDKSKKSKPAQWAIRNVRVTPISRPRNNTVNDELEKAIGLAGRLDKSSDSLFGSLRGLQSLILEYLTEAKSEGMGVAIETEAAALSELELSQLLSAMRDERKSQYTQEQNQRHVASLTAVLGRLESELWRRVNSRINTALFASKTKDFITAHDNLIAVGQMITDDTDYRWTLASRYLNDNKIVPKKIRLQPEKYRK